MIELHPLGSPNFGRFIVDSDRLGVPPDPAVDAAPGAIEALFTEYSSSVRSLRRGDVRFVRERDSDRSGPDVRRGDACRPHAGKAQLRAEAAERDPGRRGSSADGRAPSVVRLVRLRCSMSQKFTAAVPLGQRYVGTHASCDPCTQRLVDFTHDLRWNAKHQRVRRNHHPFGA